MKWIIIGLCVTLSFQSEAQESRENSGTYVYKILGRKDSMQVVFRDSLFVIGLPNIGIIKPKTGTRVGRIQLQGGKVYREGNRIEIKPYKTSTMNLTIYAWENGAQKLAYSQIITVTSRPAAVVYIGAVRQDSIIKKEDLLKDVGILIRQDELHISLWFAVQSFSLEFRKGDKLVTLISYSNRLTPLMRKYAARQPEGTPLRIRNVNYIDNLNELNTLKSATIFVDTNPIVLSVNSE